MVVVEAELDDLVDEELERHDVAIPRIRRPGQPGRLCRCDHPIELADQLLGADWVRCLLCGHDAQPRP